MKQPKWIVFAIAFIMMTGAASLLYRMRASQRLTDPGVRVAAIPIYDENKRLLSTQSVALPERLPGLNPFPLPITSVEANTLPRDTTFGRRGYETNHFQIEATVVLMGTDRASIHRPQWCLDGAGWDITSAQISEIPMSRPYPYRLPVNVLYTSRRTDHGNLGGIYVYWYVSKDKITANQIGRLWSATWTALTTGVRERWAYISYFAPCLPGREQATFERLKTAIRDSVPAFQLVSGPRDDQPADVAARN